MIGKSQRNCCFWVGAISIATILSGCVVVEGIGMAFLYKKAYLPTKQVYLDIPYKTDSTSTKNKLDLFIPAGTKWPVMIFVPGGGWNTGDKSLKVGGEDVYGNIGRFYAARGIGVAVINYRLLPHVRWEQQIEDVAEAVSWVHKNIKGYGGNPKRLFLAGHSAGAQLVDRIALDPQPLNKKGELLEIINGVISVSGAGLDLADEKTYELGASREYYEKRFAGGKNEKGWQQAASPVSYVQSRAPPFLIMYAGGETKSLIRQSQRFSEVLSQAGVTNRTVIVPGQSHTRIVLALSRADRTAAPAILEFIRNSKF